MAERRSEHHPAVMNGEGTDVKSEDARAWFIDDHVTVWEGYWERATSDYEYTCTRLGPYTLRDAVFIFLIGQAMRGITFKGEMRWHSKHGGPQIFFDPRTFEFYGFDDSWGWM